MFKNRITKIIAVCLAAITLVSSVYFCTMTYRTTAESDPNLYNIIEIVKAPQYQQLSYLHDATCPIDTSKLTTEEIKTIQAKYPIFTVGGTYSSVLVSSKEDANVTDEEFAELPTTMQLGYFEKVTSLIDGSKKYSRNKVTAANVEDSIEFYTYNGKEYKPASASSYDDEEGNTITVSAVDNATWFKVKGTDTYQPIKNLYSVTNTADIENPVKEYIYFTENSSGDYKFTPAVLGYTYEYTNNTWNKVSNVTDETAYNIVINTAVISADYTDVAELDSMYFMATRETREKIDESTRQYTYTNANILSEIIPEGKTPNITVKTVDTLTEADINSADLIYFNSFEDDTDDIVKITKQHNINSDDLVSFDNLSDENANLIYNKVIDRSVNVIFDKKDTKLDDFITGKDTKAYTKLYYFCNALYPTSYTKVYGLDKKELTPITKINTITDLYTQISDITEVYGLSYDNFGFDNIVCTENIAEHNVFSYVAIPNLLYYLSHNTTLTSLNNNECVTNNDYSIRSVLSTLIKNPKQAIVTDNLKILEVEPCLDFMSKVYWNTRIVGIDPYYSGEVDLTQMTSKEFIGHNEDFTSNYDLIYFGSNYGVMNTNGDLVIDNSNINQTKNIIITEGDTILNLYDYIDTQKGIYYISNVVKNADASANLSVDFENGASTLLLSLTSAFEDSKYIGAQSMNIELTKVTDGSKTTITLPIIIQAEVFNNALNVTNSGIYTLSPVSTANVVTKTFPEFTEPDSFDGWECVKLSDNDSDTSCVYYNTTTHIGVLKGTGTIATGEDARGGWASNRLNNTIYTQKIYYLYSGKDAHITVPYGQEFLGTLCGILQYVDCEALDFSKCANMNYLFYNSYLVRVENLHCHGSLYRLFWASNTSLQYISLSFASDVTGLNETFNGCSALKEINILPSDTSSMTTMNSAFANCSSLVKINTEVLNTSKCTNFQYTFCGCSALQYINCANWDMSNATTLLKMFSNCTKLESIPVENWYLPKLTNMQDMCNGCTSLKYIDLHNWSATKCTNAQWFLSNCNSLVYADMSGIRFGNNPSFDMGSVDMYILPAEIRDGGQSTPSNQKDYTDVNSGKTVEELGYHYNNDESEKYVFYANDGVPHVLLKTGSVTNYETTVIFDENTSAKTINLQTDVLNLVSLPQTYKVTGYDVVYNNFDTNIQYDNGVLTILNNTENIAADYIMVLRLHLNDNSYKYIPYVIHTVNTPTHVTKVKEVTAPTVYNDTTMDGLLYAHVGDRIQTCPGKYTNTNPYYNIGATFQHNYPNLAYATAQFDQVRYNNPFRLSGNDILSKQISELTNFISNGKYVIVSDMLLYKDHSVNSSSVDTTSNLYEFLVKNKDTVLCDSDITPQVISNITSKSIRLDAVKVPVPYIDTFNSGVSVKINNDAQVVELISNTTDDEYFNSFLQNSTNGKAQLTFDELGITDSNAIDTDTLFCMKNDILSITFKVYGDETKTYSAELYLDSVPDSVIYDYEKLDTPTIIDTETNQEVDTLQTGHTYTIYKQLTDENYGCLHWYVKVFNTDSACQLDGFTFRKTESEHNLYILNILPTMGESINIASNPQNAITYYGYDWKNSVKFRTYLEQLRTLGYNLNIVSMTADKLDSYMTIDYTNDTYSLEIPFTLPDGSVKNITSDYIDMLVLGFSADRENTYLDNSVAGLYLFNDFIKQKKSILVTGACISYNAGYTGIGSDNAHQDGSANTTLTRFFRDSLSLDRYGAWHYNSLPTLQDMVTVKARSLFVDNNAPYHNYNTKVGHNVIHGDVEGLLNYCSTISNDKHPKEDISGATDLWLQSILQQYTYDSSTKTMSVNLKANGNKYYSIKNDLLQDTKYSSVAPSQVYNRATEIQRGQINAFPYYLGDTLNLTDLGNATVAPGFQLDLEKENLNVWYCCSAEGLSTDTIYKYNKNDCRNTYYAYTTGSITYCDIHGSYFAGFTDDELKLLINCLCTAYRPEAIETEIKCTNANATNSGNDTYLYIDYDNQEDLSLTQNVIDNNIDTDGKTIKVYYEVQNSSVTMNKQCSIRFYDTNASKYLTLYDIKTNAPITPTTEIDSKGNEILVYDIGEKAEFYVVVDIKKFQENNNISTEDTYSIEIVADAYVTYGYSGKSISNKHNTHIVKRGLFDIH